MTRDPIQAFVNRLARTPAPPGCVNPWKDVVPGVDAGRNAAAIRRAHLLAYLDLRRHGTGPVLLAEAPGFQGGRFTGIAMTCERSLLGLRPGLPAEVILGPSVDPQRTSAQAACRNAAERAAGFCEPTSGIVWGELLRHGATDAVLWNVFPFHPVRGGDALSNRMPSGAEVQAAMPLTRAFLALFPGRAVVAIGRTARRHLDGMGLSGPTLRHPANGGATAFRLGIAPVLAPPGPQ